MNRRHAILSAATLALGAVPARRASAQARAHDPVVGTWKLVSRATVRPNGEAVTDWAGPRPTGIIMYAADGYMSVHS